jgi:hypothetical protein
MVIAVKLLDGSEQTLDVELIRMSLGGSPVELSMDGASARLRAISRGDEERWGHFVVHHSAANSFSIEMQLHGRDGDSAR